MTDAKPTDQPILKAAPGTRAKFIGLIVLASLTAAFLRFWLFPRLQAAALSASPTEAAWYVKGIFLALAIPLLGFAIFAGLHSIRIVRHDQYPPPGAWILRDTPVVRGRRAKAIAALYSVCSLACLAGTAYLAALSFLFPK